MTQCGQSESRDALVFIFAFEHCLQCFGTLFLWPCSVARIWESKLALWSVGQLWEYLTTTPHGLLASVFSCLLANFLSVPVPFGRTPECNGSVDFWPSC